MCDASDSHHRNLYSCVMQMTVMTGICTQRVLVLQLDQESPQAQMALSASSQSCRTIKHSGECDAKSL